MKSWSPSTTERMGVDEADDTASATKESNCSLVLGKGDLARASPDGKDREMEEVLGKSRGAERAVWMTPWVKAALMVG